MAAGADDPSAPRRARAGDGARTSSGPAGVPPRPTPRALTGRRDPATRVQAVDWSADGSVPPQPASEEPRDTPTALTPPRRPRTVELPRRPFTTPSDAVLSLDPQDPRPAPRPLRIAEEALRTVGVPDVTAERIVQAVAAPEETWTSDAGTSDHFLDREIAVQVRRADSTVIGVFARGYALAVRPEAIDDHDEHARAMAGRSSRGGAGTRVPTTRTELLRALEAAGFVTTAGSGHGRITHPEHPGLFVPLASTPSDVRYTRHAVAQIRRVFGIDLRR